MNNICEMMYVMYYVAICWYTIYNTTNIFVGLRDPGFPIAGMCSRLPIVTNQRRYDERSTTINCIVDFWYKVVWRKSPSQYGRCEGQSECTYFFWQGVVNTEYEHSCKTNMTKIRTSSVYRPFRLIKTKATFKSLDIEYLSGETKTTRLQRLNSV